MAVSVSIKVPNNRRALTHLLNALVAINLDILKRSRGGLPSLYKSGIRYQREARNPRTGKRKEEWRTLADLHRFKVGDCEDLAAARVAELRLKGIAARPWLMKVGPRLFHVVVKLPGGGIEDPSRKLGMPGPRVG